MFVTIFVVTTAFDVFSRIDGAILLALAILIGQVAFLGYVFRRLAILVNAPPGKTGWY
jgi:hypothetical protein